MEDEVKNNEPVIEPELPEATEELDEKALREMIAKNVNDEITAKVNTMADQLVNKFVAGAKAQRQKALDTGKKPEDSKRNVTREFLKALMVNDRAKLVELRKKDTTFNYDDDGARGGYLIPDELMTEVLRVAQTEYGVARREMRYLPFTGVGNERKIPTLASGVTVDWVDEGAKKGGTNPAFGLITQTLKKLAAIIPITEELLEDSGVNLTQLVAQLFAEAVAKEEDVQFFAGTGSPWTGLLNNGSVNHVDMGAGETIADITADDLLDMIDETPAGALAGAKFYLHRHALSYIRKLKSDNAYIFQAPSGTVPGTIWGYEYVLVEACPDKTGGADPETGIIAFGNLKLAAVFGDKQQIRAKLLDQATITDGDGSTVINLAQQDMVALRLEERVGYVLALPDAITVLKTGSAS